MVATEQTLATGKQLDALCVNTIRTLAMDGVQQANSGHPGAPMALAPVTYSLWQQILRRERIGIADNFFHAGGDSIKAIQIISRLGMAGWQLSIKDIFTHPTIAALAKRVKKTSRTYEQGLIVGKIPLTPIQQRFFSKHFEPGDLNHFNQAMLLEWPETIDIPVLEKCLSALLQHHDMLRTTFQPEGDTWVQYVAAQGVPDIQLEVLAPSTDRAVAIEQLANQAQASLNITAGPLVKAVVFRQAAEKDQLLVIIHHAIVDWVSWRILLEDLKTAYQQRLLGHGIALPAKTADFRLWAEHIIQYGAQRFHREAYNYWKSAVLESNNCPNILPVDMTHTNLVQDTEIISVSLSHEQTRLLFHRTHQAFNTEINDVLLCALSRALKHTFGGDRYSVFLEGHGRQDILGLDVSRTATVLSNSKCALLAAR